MERGWSLGKQTCDIHDENNLKCVYMFLILYNCWNGLWGIFVLNIASFIKMIYVGTGQTKFFFLNSKNENKCIYGLCELV
jgi:hypothetical protein